MFIESFTRVFQKPNGNIKHTTRYIVFSNLCRCVCNKDSQAKTTNRKNQRREVYDPLHLVDVKGKTINSLTICI